MEKSFFTEQITLYQESMYRVAYSLLRNNEDVKDAIQETVLKAWTHQNRLRNTHAFRPWIVRILVNECHNIFRKRKNLVPLEEYQEPAQNIPDLSLHLLLMNLSPDDRLLLTLHYAERMREKEIAQILHLPPSTVRGRLARARMALRKELNHEEF